MRRSLQEELHHRAKVVEVQGPTSDRCARCAPVICHRLVLFIVEIENRRGPHARCDRAGDGNAVDPKTGAEYEQRRHGFLRKVGYRQPPDHFTSGVGSDRLPAILP